MVRAGARLDDRASVREKLAPNGVPPADVTVPLMTAPLLATNETDALVICVLVTVTTWTPAAGASVHVTVAFPSLSVVLVAAETDPPPATVHVSGTPATDRLAPSSTCTTSGNASDAETSPDWFPPETMTR